MHAAFDPRRFRRGQNKIWKIFLGIYKRTKQSEKTYINMSTETEYFSKDFDWEELKQDVEKDPSLSYHFVQSNSSSSDPSLDSDAWKRFHIRHSTGKFFKERRYLLKEFPELVSCDESSKVLEVGCGNGSTAISILRGNKNIVVYACDCSPEALERAREIIDGANIDSINHRVHLFQCDFSVSQFPKWISCDFCRGNVSPRCLGSKENDGINQINSSLLSKSNLCIKGVDFITLIFILSAVPVERMSAAIRECFSVLKPGGLLLFRDYGLYDMTMLRFTPGQKVGFREYMRSDGTRSYFFCLDAVRNLFVSAGFSEVELEYCCIKSVNRQNGKGMQRVWVHAKFQKPI